MFVRTVTGDVSSGDVGFTHCHDHLFVFQTEYTRIPQRILLDDYEKTRDEVLSFRDLGGSLIVDAQPFGAGRNASFLKRLSVETGVYIIGATGLHKREFYGEDFWSFHAAAEDIAGLFISEIEEGMYDLDCHDPFAQKTGIKAGVIKIATDRRGLTAYYRKLFDAAAIACKKTGAPIITHTELSAWGAEQAAYLVDRGVDAGKIIISHMDRVIDIENNFHLAGMGIYLEYDTIARYKYHDDNTEIELIKAMVDAGFGSRIVLGMDSTRERMKSYGGRVGLAHIAEYFVPMLKKRGIDDWCIEMITAKNPARALTVL